MSETPEQAEAAQRQMEEFARLAHDVNTAVEGLRNAFCELDDFPTSIGEAMVQLTAAAATIAHDALSWAEEGGMSANGGRLQ